MTRRGPKPREAPESVEAVREIAARIRGLRDELVAAMVVAKGHGATGEHLADAAGITRGTVYAWLDAAVSETAEGSGRRLKG